MKTDNVNRLVEKENLPVYIYTRFQGTILNSKIVEKLIISWKLIMSILMGDFTLKIGETQ